MPGMIQRGQPELQLRNPPAKKQGRFFQLSEMFLNGSLAMLGTPDMGSIDTST